MYIFNDNNENGNQNIQSLTHHILDTNLPFTSQVMQISIWPSSKWVFLIKIILELKVYLDVTIDL